MSGPPVTLVDAFVVKALPAPPTSGTIMMLRLYCGWCKEDISGEGEARLVSASNGWSLTPIWCCADEDACFARQDCWDLAHGYEPQRHTRFIQVVATTPEGELVL